MKLSSYSLTNNQLIAMPEGKRNTFRVRFFILILIFRLSILLLSVVFWFFWSHDYFDKARWKIQNKLSVLDFSQAHNVRPNTSSSQQTVTTVFYPSGVCIVCAFIPLRKIWVHSWSLIPWQDASADLYSYLSTAHTAISHHL